MVVLMVFHFANLPHKVGDCVGRVGMDKNFCSATAEPLNREPLKLNSYIFIPFMPPPPRERRTEGREEVAMSFVAD